MFGLAITALVISIVATGIAVISLAYAHRADRRAEAAESRDVARFVGERSAAEAATLERIGSIMREVAKAVEESAIDPQAPRRINARKARLVEAIEVSGFDLPACSDYASNVDAAKLPAAEAELERTKAGLEPRREPPFADAW